MNKNIIWLLWIIIIIGSIAYLAIENSIESDGNNLDNDLQKIRVGYIPIADCAQLYIAEEEGFFKENGIEIEFVKLAGGAKILEALAGGSIDIGFSNVVSVMLANYGGLDFIPITGGPRTNIDHKESGLLVLEDSGIKSIEDLENSKIAINTRKNIVELFVRDYLKQNGVNTSSIEFIECSFPKMLQLLDSRKVDAVAAVEPFVSFGTQSKEVNNLGDYFVSVMPSMEISTYNADKEWVVNNPEVVGRFKKAIAKSTDFANNNREKLEEIITKYTSLKSEQIKNMVLPYYGSNIDEKSFGTVLNKVKDIGWVAQDLTLNEILD